MMERKTAHIISHSHWDREWYMSLEEHRYYLVKLFDDLLEKLADDPDFHSFHLDGQTIMVDDYLQVRPEKEKEVKSYIREGRLIIGPWYILQDAFLTSAEANVRNLLYGMKDTKKLGQEGILGYFPDTFGIYGQAPQLLKQANIEVAAFGRGVTPTGFNNQVHHSDDFSSPYSEMTWESPDGSKVLGILFANWYSNGNEIPESGDEAQAFWEKKLADAEKFASTSKLLFMNGCDHQPLQKNITSAINTANELFPHVTFKHSSFLDYIEELKLELPEDLQTIRGELRNQKTDGWSTLVNTASSRIYLKQANDRCQTLLEKVLEPIGLMSGNRSLHNDFSEFYWKMLMENHPHDSICGCSVDEVHREMETRFNKVEKGAGKYIEEQAREIAESLSTQHENPEAVPIVVFHTSGQASGHVIKEKIAFKKIYFNEMDFREIPGKLKREPLPSFYIERSDKSRIHAAIKDLGVNFGYELPTDGFRKPYYAREAEVTFWLESEINVGYEICYLVPSKDHALAMGRAIWNEPEKKLENENLLVSIHENGCYSILDKHTGYEYKNLGVYENTGDIGNEYMFKATEDGILETTEYAASTVEVVENNEYRASIAILSSISVPIEADEQLKIERENLVWHPERKARRHETRTVISLKTVLVLEKEAQGLQVEVMIENQAKDHRLRALFPVGTGNSHHYADSIFEVVKRPNEPESQWENPSFDHHMQRFVSLNDRKQGLTIATKGLHEYEIVGGNSIAVTLLRAVGELGDWGVFETPEAQCIGINKAEFMIIPHKGDVISSRSYTIAYNYPLRPTAIQVDQGEGVRPPTASLFNWSGEGLSLTACKPAADRKGMLLRWFNPTEELQNLSVEVKDTDSLYISTILEEKQELLGKGRIETIVKPQQIITLFIE
jgi:alpha-mannosidase